MKFLYAAVACAIALSGCAGAGRAVGLGSNANAERAMFGQSPRDVLQTLTSACAAAGLEIGRVESRRLVCTRALAPNEVALAALQLGRSATGHREELEFVVSGSGRSTHVEVNHFIKARTPGGTTMTLRPHGSQHKMTLKQWLYAAGGV